MFYPKIQDRHFGKTLDAFISVDKLAVSANHLFGSQRS